MFRTFISLACEPELKPIGMRIAYAQNMGAGGKVNHLVFLQLLTNTTVWKISLLSLLRFISSCLWSQ